MWEYDRPNNPGIFERFQDYWDSATQTLGYPFIRP